MRIAVISDTHNNLPAGLGSAIAEADEIWHLGDICTPAILAEICRLGPPVFAVRGNCDPRGLAPESLVLERGGHVFCLLHVPPHGAPAGASFVLHGHTHVPRDETLAGIRYLNPGTVSKPNHGAPPSYAWLEVGDGSNPLWTVVPVGAVRG